MRYLMLIYGDEKAAAGMTPEQQAMSFNSWGEYDRQIGASGKKQAGEALQPTMIATTVRMADGKKVITDGPFAETKEQLGGFYLIDAKDLDDAVDWASKMPNLPYGGSVEIRPIMEMAM